MKSALTLLVASLAALTFAVPAGAATYQFSGPDVALDDGSSVAVGFSLTQDGPVDGSAIVPLADPGSLGLAALLSSGAGLFDDLVVIADSATTLAEAFFDPGAFSQDGTYADVVGGYALVVSGLDAPAAAPEPASLAALGAGLIGIGAAIRRRRLTAACDRAP